MTVNDEVSKLSELEPLGFTFAVVFFLVVVAASLFEAADRRGWSSVPWMIFAAGALAAMLWMLVRRGVV